MLQHFVGTGPTKVLFVVLATTLVLAFVLSIHLCEVLQSCNCISSVFLTHAALVMVSRICSQF